MALPELDMNDDLEADSEEDTDLEGEDMAEESGDVDPMFAADMADTGLDLSDAQLAALQRAILGVMANMGGMGGGGMGSPPAAPMF